LRIDAKEGDTTWCHKLDGDQNANNDKLRSLVTKKKKEGDEHTVITRDFDIESAIQEI
jgi:C4-type Zn-finger protein